MRAGVDLHAKHCFASAGGCGNASDRDIRACGGTHQKRLAVPRAACSPQGWLYREPYARMAEQLSTSLCHTLLQSAVPQGARCPALCWGWLPLSSVCFLGDMGRALVSDACGVSELLGSIWLPGELKLRRLEQQAVSPWIAAGDAWG